MVVTSVAWLCGRADARRNPKDYFLGEKKLPWYVVGTSMVASDISSETFIANVGIAYQYGMVVATTGWNAWIIYSIFHVRFPAVLRADRPVHDAAVSRAALQLDLPVPVRDFAGDRLHLHAAGRVAVRGRAGDREDLRAADFRAIWRPTSNGGSSFSP